MASTQTDGQEFTVTEPAPNNKPSAIPNKKKTATKGAGVLKKKKAASGTAPINSIGKYKIEKEVIEYQDGTKIFQVSLPDLSMKLLLRYVPIIFENKMLIEQMKIDIRVFSSLDHPIIAKYIDSFVLDSDPLVFW